MGMFDYVKCEYPLPDDPPEWAKAEFQTKSFDDLLENYIITGDGQLIRHNRFGQERIEYHGDVRFYTTNVTGNVGGNLLLLSGTGDKPIHFVYLARFTNGRLEWIKRLDEEL